MPPLTARNAEVSAISGGEDPVLPNSLGGNGRAVALRLSRQTRADLKAAERRGVEDISQEGCNGG